MKTRLAVLKAYVVLKEPKQSIDKNWNINDCKTAIKALKIDKDGLIEMYEALNGCDVMAMMEYDELLKIGIVDE